jgi:hypothetical protein
VTDNENSLAKNSKELITAVNVFIVHAPYDVKSSLSPLLKSQGSYPY